MLARLETASAPSRSRFFKACAVAVPAALFVVVGIYLPRSAVAPSTVAPEPPQVVERTSPAAAVPERPASIPAPPPIAKEQDIVPPTFETASSRSPTFPSRDGLSPQEALLVRFVRSTPGNVTRRRRESAHRAATN